MKLTRTALLAVLALAACSRDKVQPADSAAAEATLTPEQEEAKSAAEYKKRQAAFTDSVLHTVTPTTKLVKKYGEEFAVGSLKMRDSLLTFIAKTPQCYKDGKALDPYLAGTATFYIHMSVVGSDVIRVQESQWTSQAGNITDKCFNDAARQWKLGMGLAKQGKYLLQVQFR
jgi:hypothetical protein